ncbi:MAG: peptidase domain-containing ABC transporter [Saprospiraceae bacterium]|nr:peptidase domain-containing ABC transporter [Saprospiraceae bacterium]
MYFKYFKQHDEMDCGATCLRMVALHYGKYFSLDYLREISHLDRNGISLLSLNNAAETIGFQSLAANLSYDDLINQVPLPAILHWDNNHFVVAVAGDEKQLTIADPAFGKKQLKRDEIIKHWYNGNEAGIALLLEPSPTFEETQGQVMSEASIFDRFVAVFKSHKLLFTSSILTILFSSIILSFFSFIIQSIFDVGIKLSDHKYLLITLFIYALLFTTFVILNFIRNSINAFIGTKTNINFSTSYMKKLVNLPLRFFDSKSIGDILRRINDNERVESFLSNEVMNVAASVLIFVIFSGLIAYFNFKIFILFFVITAFSSAVSLFLINQRKNLDYAKSAELATNQEQIFQFVAAIKDIKLFNAENKKREIWEQSKAAIFGISDKILANDRWLNGFSLWIIEMKNLIILIYSATLVIKSEMSIGVLVAIQFILVVIKSPINEIINYFKKYQEIKLSVERIDEIQLRNDVEIEEVDNFDVKNFSNIIFNEVTFRYGGAYSPTVLNSINVAIPKGKVTAIVGSSGSGKTTLLNLLLQLYAPNEGAILLDDISLNTVPAKLWRKNVAVVLQDGFLFNDTIANNISMNEVDCDEEKVKFALDSVNMSSVIDRLPDGIHTWVTKEGVGFSQGQKQRLLIARAIYKNASIIVLDEAASALDAYNELLIMENLLQIFKDKTIILVANRISSVRNADNIILLENGEIIEQGTHHDLVRQKGAYFFLVKNQLEIS